jgi:hypothetical protein
VKAYQTAENIPSAVFPNKMNKAATDSSHGSTHHTKKKGQSLVLSLADQKLTLEDNEDLERFVNGKFGTHLSLLGARPDCHAGLVKSNKISRKPWKRSIHLELSEADLTHPDTSYSYPVDIRLDSVSRLMVFKRLLGLVDSVRVYTGPLAKL